MGQLKIPAILLVLFALIWVAYSAVQKNQAVEPANSETRLSDWEAATESMPGKPSVTAGADGIALPAADPEVAEEPAEHAPGTHPGAPVWMDKDAVGPGELPEDNAYPMAPEAGDPGTSGMGPDAFEYPAPMGSTEAGEPPSVESNSPPEGGGG